MQGNGMTESAADLLDDVPGQNKPQAEEKGKVKAAEPDAEPEETPAEKARRECLELNAFCLELSEKVSALVQGDIEFESLVSSLQAATVEYDELSARLKRKRKTGELTRRSKRRLRRAGKEVRKRREDLNVYMYYHDINLLMLESPRSYACMLCRNKQLTEGDDGEEYCRFRQEELDEE